MRIGIIGAGNIGATTARLFANAGHDVAVSNSRGPASLQSLIDEIGPRARAMTVADTARFGEVVLLAVPWRKPEALPTPQALQDRIVIDAMNPYAEGGRLEDLQGLTSSEHTRRRLPGARLVKAFNTIWFKHLAANGRTDLPVSERHAILSPAMTKQPKVVMRLIEEIGFGPVDMGSLADGGRRQESGSPVYNKPMTAREAQQHLAANPGR